MHHRPSFLPPFLPPFLPSFLPPFLPPFLHLTARTAVSAVLLALFGCTQLGGVTEEPPAAAAQSKPKPETGSELNGPLLYQLMAAEAAVQRGDYKTAYETYLSVARQTRDARLAQRATEVAIAGRAFDLALESAKLWRELAPESSEPVQMSVALLIASGRLAEAAPLLRDHVQKSAQPIEALLRAQRLLARSGDRPAAFGLLEFLAKPYRDDAQVGADARLILAAGAQAAGDTERAIKEAQAALELRPDFERAALATAQLMLRGEGQDKDKEAEGRAQALAFLGQFVERNPAALEAGITHARLLVADGKYAEARTQFERLAQQDPRNLDVLYALGVLSLDAPPPRDAARSYFQRFLAIVEDTPQPGRDPDPAYLNMARIAEDEKKYDEALTWLARIDDGELMLNARVRQAVVLGKMKRVDEARKVLAETPVTNDGGRVQLLIAEGQVLRDARRHRESFDLLTDGLTRYPDDTTLLYDTAMAAERLGRVDVMEKHLRRVIQLKPQDAHAYNALGYTLADRNTRLTEALQLVEQALKLSPEDGYILDSMGWVHYRLGNMKNAREYLERAFKLKPEAEVGAHLGEVLWHSGQRAEARRVLRVAREADAENETLRATLARLKVRF